MIGRLLALLALLALILCSSGFAEEIPLSEVWGYGMLGTRDIARLETQFFTDKFKSRPVRDSYEQYKQDSFVHRIRQLLGSRPSTGTKRGFAVEGSGLDALGKAYEVLSGAKLAQQEFLAGGDMSLFFFSYRGSSYLRIKSIERDKKVFRIRVMYVPNETLRMTEYFALIPVGDLSPGKYEVSVDWLDSDENIVPSNDRLICQSFSFTVNERPKE